MGGCGEETSETGRVRRWGARGPPGQPALLPRCREATWGGQGPRQTWLPLKSQAGPLMAARSSPNWVTSQGDLSG